MKRASHADPNIICPREGFYGVPRSNRSSLYISRRSKRYPKPLGRPNLKCFNCNSPNHLREGRRRPTYLTQKVNALLKESPRNAKSMILQISQRSENDSVKDTQYMNPQEEQLKGKTGDTDHPSEEELLVHSSEDRETNKMSCTLKKR